MNSSIFPKIVLLVLRVAFFAVAAMGLIIGEWALAYGGIVFGVVSLFSRAATPEEVEKVRSKGLFERLFPEGRVAATALNFAFLGGLGLILAMESGRIEFIIFMTIAFIVQLLYYVGRWLYRRQHDPQITAGRLDDPRP